MAFGKVLKVGSAVLAAAGGIAGGVEVVSTVVEQYNYENQHVINVSDTYWINGVEVTKEEFEAYLNGTEAITLYYGAIDDVYNFTLSDLNTINFVGTTSYTFHVDAGNIVTEEGQYVTFAIPESYDLISFIGAENRQSYSFETITVNGYDVNYLTTPVYNEDLGGENYTVTFR